MEFELVNRKDKRSCRGHHFKCMFVLISFLLILPPPLLLPSSPSHNTN